MKLIPSYFFFLVIFIFATNQSTLAQTATSEHYVANFKFIDQKQKKMLITFKTIEKYSEQCQLKIVGIITLLPIGKIHGKIEISTALYRASCRPDVGAHSGSFLLQRGENLPQIPNGRYDVFIDGEYLNGLWLSDDVITNGRGFEWGNG
ncbi:MAG: hypothetical protein A2504_05625 [Bdellovibrionales bacterium RIFOXYD12_FULL_39_22]|nr:MAG: hypothetical protein A2385_06200 [Bdellovibrionales bacterium RIFOXYB1_FULL_39_21]OFZ41870.1 MAG: hypothetical protein A2485_08170 [Bdellovibrionales bacterium RIFOXYC12_FULL_39_17]OFZ50586.1 MAG: hypothetical protein A2404_05120 [Bdellovibrionales bacterium RIFOXYC1_FULL_39_130]OFZ77809.1 MAG: hypothetical protein A2560_00290 [Bdellovibrionales bacterium RIFOXYD1_FULL_39_84]OFZ93755.1 MAG: hypothetical protein A2504_05625 [Bdellovibrionales bacterium RIFOXYD12_FULL_39_22]HLE11560.1 hy